jgi:hypothetical protein
MTQDYYLRFSDQQQALEVMQSFTYTDDEGNTHLSQGGHDYALWEVGILDETDSWHINLRVINPELDVSALEPYMVTPRNPKCVWA